MLQVEAARETLVEDVQRAVAHMDMPGSPRRGIARSCTLQVAVLAQFQPTSRNDRHLPVLTGSWDFDDIC